MNKIGNHCAADPKMPRKYTGDAFRKEILRGASRDDTVGAMPQYLDNLAAFQVIRHDERSNIAGFVNFVQKRAEVVPLDVQIQQDQFGPEGFEKGNNLTRLIRAGNYF